MNRLFLGSYLLLLILTYFLMNYMSYQRLLTVCWIMAVTVSCGLLHRNRVMPFGAVLYTLVVSQLPGIISAIASLWFVSAGHANEWANGLLEIWYYPFVPLLELLPKYSLWDLSDVYLATCLLPVVLALMALVGWFWGTPRQQGDRAGG